MLIDTHAHLNDNRLAESVPNIVSQLASDNILAVVNVGYDRQSSETGLRLAKTYNQIYCALGIHPHDSKMRKQEDYDFFIKAAKAEKKVVAIGETGLDYYYNFSEKDVQKKVFAEHIELADSLKLPLIIHLRDAQADMAAILKENKRHLNNGAVLHCYTGSAEMIKVYLNLCDMYFSFGGAVTFKNANKEEVVKAVPLNKLMLETDCPYMTPHPFRGELNYPKYINLTYQKIQNWYPNEDIESITTQNAKRFFKI
jgi:TatD DNase family protein